MRAGRTLLLGSLIGKAATMLSLPVIARLYVPEDFSDMALFVAILTAIGPLLTLRFSQALGLPRSNVVLVNLVAVCLVIGIIVIALLGLALGGYIAIFGWVQTPVSNGGLLMVILAAVPALSYEILSALAIRDRKYTLVAKTQASQAVVGALAKVGLGFAGGGALGLVAGHVVGQFSGIRPLLSDHRAKLRERAEQVSFRKMRAVARMFWQFPAYRFPSQLLLAFASQSPIIFVVHQYSPNQSGQFALAMTLVTTAINLIGANLGRAFLGEAGQIYRHERHKLAGYTIRMQALFVAMFAPIGLAAYFVAEPLLHLVLGNGWALASQIAPVLIIYGLAHICSAPVIQVLTFLKKQVIFLLINAVRLAAVCSLFLVAHSGNMGIVDFSRYYSAMMVGFYIFVALLVVVSLVSQGRERLPLRQQEL